MNNIPTSGYYDATYGVQTSDPSLTGTDYLMNNLNTAPDPQEEMVDTYARQLEMMLPAKRYAHPLLVLGLTLFCFPIGLFVMLCFTKWGAFPKILITLFVLAAATAVYEILVAKNVLLLPSLIGMIKDLFTV